MGSMWVYDFATANNTFGWQFIKAQTFAISFPLINTTLEHNTVYFTTIIAYNRGVSLGWAKDDLEGLVFVCAARYGL